MVTQNFNFLERKDSSNPGFDYKISIHNPNFGNLDLVQTASSIDSSSFLLINVAGDYSAADPTSIASDFKGTISHVYTFGSLLGGILDQAMTMNTGKSFNFNSF